MTKNQLKSFRNKNIEIKKLEQSIEEIQARAELQASLLSHTPRGTNENECKILKSIERLETVREKLYNTISDFSYQLDEVWSCIHSIKDDRIRTVFSMRYLNAETFETIAYDMQMSWRHVHRLHSEGLKEVETWVNN